MNNISAFASVELNLDVRDKGITKEVSDQLQAIIENDCRQIHESDFLIANNGLKRLLYYFTYRLTHFIFYLFTFYFIQRKER